METSWFTITLVGDAAHKWCSTGLLVEEIFNYLLEIRADVITTEAYMYKLKDAPEGTCTFFFSPRAAIVFESKIKQFHPEPCDKPDASDVVPCMDAKDAVKLLNS